MIAHKQISSLVEAIYHTDIGMSTPSSELSCSIIIVDLLLHLLMLALLLFSFSRSPGQLSARPQFYLSADTPEYWPTKVAVQKNVNNSTASSEEQKGQTCSSRWKQIERILAMIDSIEYSEFYS